jgi:hypothetical protein
MRTLEGERCEPSLRNCCRPTGPELAGPILFFDTGLVEESFLSKRRSSIGCRSTSNFVEDVLFVHVDNYKTITQGLKLGSTVGQLQHKSNRRSFDYAAHDDAESSFAQDDTS